MMAAAKDPAIARTLGDPFALTPGFDGPEQPDGNTPYEDAAVGAWVGPFMMAGINTKAVHRTNFLLGHPGARISNTARCRCWTGRRSRMRADWGGFAFGAGPMPKPGEGPTREERENGWYDILFVAETADGRSLRAAVKGDRDPGYGSTSKILAEAAIALAGVPRTATPAAAGARQRRWRTPCSTGCRRRRGCASRSRNSADARRSIAVRPVRRPQCPAPSLRIAA